MDCRVPLWNLICLKNSVELLWNKWNSHTCIPLFSLLPAVDEQKCLTTEHIPLQDKCGSAICLLLVSVNSLILAVLLPLVKNIRKRTNILLGLSAAVGEWSVSSTADYLSLLVRSDRRSSTSNSGKTKRWNNPIWFTYRRCAAVTI